MHTDLPWLSKTALKFRELCWFQACQLEPKCLAVDASWIEHTSRHASTGVTYADVPLAGFGVVSCARKLLSKLK